MNKRLISKMPYELYWFDKVDTAKPADIELISNSDRINDANDM